MFQLVEEYLLVFAPTPFYERVQAIVAHMGHDGFTPYECEHVLGEHYQYNAQMQPIRLALRF